MKVYLGGTCQGKTDFVRAAYPEAEYFFSPTVSFLEQSVKKIQKNDTVIWDGFNFSIRKETSSDDFNLDETLMRILSLAENVEFIIVSDEVGNGIVPMDKNEREYREATGRILIELASRSEAVSRIICGMEQKIK